LILGVIWLTGCGGSQATSPPPPTVPPKAVVTTNPLVPTPQAALAQEPFQGAPKYPDVYLLTAAQRKSDLASFLYTTVRDLDRVNPGVPDPIPSGTLVAIPYDYLVTQPKPFASIAAETGLSKEVLFTYNPVLRNTENLAQGTRLVMPRLLIVSDVTQLSAAVERLAVSRVALMQANPNLAGTEKLLSGTVLILPPEDQP
jgi:LysM repeat protein